ncbi:MAG: hypothetical protein WC428_00290 [Candidatus Paceibacterota bacterium]
MKNFTKTKEEWEAIGILSITFEDRKDKVVNALNIGVQWLIGLPISTNVNDYRESIVLPVIVKIANEVDVSEEEVLTICKEIYTGFKIFDPSTLPNSIDPEAEFVRAFCVSKINQLNSK